MKTLIISDIHGSAKRLEEVLNTPYPYDMVYLVGDLMYHGPRNPILDDYDPARVASILNSINKPICAVRGNCDSEVDQMLLDFPMMQDYALINNANRSIMMTHGHIIDPKNAKDFNTDLFISGHTHLPVLVRHESQVILNPGSIALPKGNHPNTYAYLEDDQLTIYTLNHTIYKQISF